MKVVDMHCDTILRLYDEGGCLSKNDFNIDLKKMVKGDYLLQNFAMFVNLSDHLDPLTKAQRLIDLYYTELEKSPELIKPVYSYEDILNNQKNGLMSAMLTLEEGAVVNNDLAILRNYYRLGVRMITLTWNHPNGIGYPNLISTKEFKDLYHLNTEDGLTDFGIAYVKEMERLGIIIDVSHLSDAGFYDVLKEAQELGYAEADPTSDIEGYDAQYKLAILASLAFGTKIDIDKVYRQGITNITSLDMEYAKSLGMVIKLLAIVKEKNGKLELRVHPTMIPETHPLANVYDSFNAVFIKGNAVGDLMFYGRGAGDLPTGSAVVADIISVIRDEIASKENSRSAVKNELWKKELMDISEVESRYYIRLSVEDKPGVLADLTAILGYNKVSLRSVMQKGKSRSADGGVILVLTTHHTTEADVKASLETMKKLESVKSIDNLIRIEDFTR